MSADNRFIEERRFGGQGQTSGMVNPFGGSVQSGSAPARVAMAQGNSYNPFLDPGNPGILGMIGRLSGSPSRKDAMMAQQGGINGRAMQSLSQRLQQGMSPQQAVADFINTPEGMDFFTGAQDPTGTIKEFMQIAVAPPDDAAARQDTFSGLPGSQGVPSGTLQEDLGIITQKAAEAARMGDTEGAKLLMQQAEERRLVEAQLNPTTDDIIEYNLEVQQAKAAGQIPPSFSEFMARPDRRKGVNITNNMGEPLSSGMEKLATDDIVKADNLDDEVAAIERFRADAGMTSTGWAQAVTLPIQQAAKSVFGIDLNPELSLLENLNAQQNRMVLQLRNPESGGGLPGSASNKDLDFLKAATAGVEKTPAANQLILTTFKADRRRQALLTRARAEYIFEKGNLKGWSDARRDLIEKTPFFNDDEINMINNIVTEAQTSPAAPGKGDRVTTGGNAAVRDMSDEDLEAIVNGQRNP